MSKILRTGESCWAVAHAESTGLLVDGEDYYRAFFEAATRAERFILMAGWQFDSEVELLRGEAATCFEAPKRLLPFLEELCRRNPTLSVYILAWDYSFVYSLEREVMQRWIFNSKTHDRIVFRFDSVFPRGGSQHQKFVVIDGVLAFAGGTDLCAERWDDREHSVDNPHRADLRSGEYGPYHEVQAYASGDVALELTGLFRQRWRTATGERLDLPVVFRPSPPAVEPTYSLPSGPVGLSRTRGVLMRPPLDQVHEIRRLYEIAIEAAEQVVYVENQFFTSTAVAQALAKRLRDHRRSRLQVVVVLPRQAGAMKEEVALGLRQAGILRELRAIAEQHGHALGVYYTVARNGGREVPVYIHSKVLIVDDVLVSVGSANATNRSLGLDTELNLSWEGTDPATRRSIRRIRDGLIAEHLGMTEPLPSEVAEVGNLVRSLSEIAEARSHRLRGHPLEAALGDGFLQAFLPEDVAFDPSQPVEQGAWEAIAAAGRGGFSSGIQALRRFLESVSGISRPPLSPSGSS